MNATPSPSSWVWTPAVSSLSSREDYTLVTPEYRVPRFGDVVLARATPGHHLRVEDIRGNPPFSVRYQEVDVSNRPHLVCAFGTRYAVEEFQGVVPTSAVTRVDLLNAGGTCGQVVAQNRGVRPPTKLCIVGYLANANGEIVNTTDRAPSLDSLTTTTGTRARTIVVTGSKMDAGKSTAASAVVGALTARNHQVGAGKVTGTARFHDIARVVGGRTPHTLHFAHLGYPSTAGLSEDALLALFWEMHHRLSRAAGDEGTVVIEIADGLLQRETQLLLGSEQIHSVIDSIVYACSDPLSALGCLPILSRWGYRTPVFSGKIANHVLGIQELREALPGDEPVRHFNSLQPNHDEVLEALSVCSDRR